MSKQPRSLLRILNELRRTANFTNAGFSDIKIGERFESSFPFNTNGVSTDQITEAIKESTEIYRDSWVNPLIDDLILWANGEKELHQIEWDRL